MKHFLTDEQRVELRRLHRSQKDGRSRDRIKAVLLSDKGWSYRHISEALLLDEDTISKHVQEFVQDSKLTNIAGGSNSKISPEQREELIAHLEEKTYLSVKEICDYVLKTYGITYTIQGMTGWLHANGFSYKKPKPTPAKADPAQQLLFIALYEALLKNLSEKEAIVFMDAVHPTMQTKITYGWIRTGKDKLIPTTASRTRFNFIGALNLETMQLDIEQYDTINHDAVIEFLRALRKKYKYYNVLHIILDRGPYNICEKTKNEAKALGIKLHYLPPYSPNLNPIERVWKIVNEHVRNNRFFSTAKEFKEALNSFFSVVWKDISKSMVDRVNDCFQIIQKPNFSF